MEEEIKMEVESDSDEATNHSTDTNSSSSSSSSSSDNTDSEQVEVEEKTEVAKICKNYIELPKGLCENADIFNEFFSVQMWNGLPEPIKNHLKTNFLPTFPSNDNLQKDITVQKLFNREEFRFGSSPLVDLQRNLELGNLKPEIAKLQSSIRKTQRREQRFQEVERISRIAKSVMISREKLLQTSYNAPPGTIIKTERHLSQQQPHEFISSPAAARAKKRYFQEISSIIEEIGIDGPLSSDENYPEGPPPQLSRKQKRHLSGIQGGAVSPGAEPRICSTVVSRSGSFDHLVGPGGTAPLTEEFYRQMIFAHKKRKIDDPEHPDLDTTTIKLKDVHMRTQVASGHRRPLPHSKLFNGGSPSSTTSSKKSQLSAGITGTGPGKVAVKQEKFDPLTFQSQFQQQLIRSHSLLTVGQQHSHPYLSEDSDDGLIASGSIKQEPKLTLSPPDLISTVPTVLKPLHRQLSLPPPSSTSSNPLHSSPVASASLIQKTASLASSPINPYTSTVTAATAITHPGIIIKQEPNVDVGGGKSVNSKKRNNMSVLSSMPPLASTQSEQLQKLQKQQQHQQQQQQQQQQKQHHNNQQGRGSSGLINIANYSGKVKPATVSDLEGIDMMHLPVDLDESGNIDIMGDIDDMDDDDDDDQMQELMQETHACFLSLVRDIFCSTPDHRATLENLQKKVLQWLGNPITPLNDWYTLSESWLNLVPSAINFLSGEFVDQPEDFVPYIEYKMNLAIYQWIGAGRDTDSHLIPLCQYWLSRKMEMASKPMRNNNNMSEKLSGKTTSAMGMSSLGSSDVDEDGMPDRPPSPPPPRCPTSWSVSKANPREVDDFRVQERDRFEHPHLAFVYRMHGYESVVGPVKGIYTHQVPGVNKARGHNTLVADRPNFVTILTLVRDATARLPNGEGTRADICELLKSSQYINPDAADAVLQTIVSGALDRMHTEHDPCVRYDPKRKIWIYLHRNRTKDEFERLHQQFQGLGKHKKSTPRKIKTKKMPITSPPKTIITASVVSSAVTTPVTTSCITTTSAGVSNIMIMAPSSSSSSSSSSLTGATTSAIISTSSLLPPMQMPALSTISSPTIIPTPPPQPPPLLNKIMPSKSISSIKPELVPIKLPQNLDNKMPELIDVEATLDAQNAPVLINITASQPSPQTHNITSASPQNMPSLIIDNKSLQQQTQKMNKILANNKHLTPVKISTSCGGFQTVHVSTASATMPSASTKPHTSILSSANAQSILLNHNRAQSPIVVTSSAAAGVGKKLVSNKPMLINQTQAPPLSQQKFDETTYIIPINITGKGAGGGAIGGKKSAVSPKIMKSIANNPPALTSTVTAKSILHPQTSVVTATGVQQLKLNVTRNNQILQPGKSLINPALIQQRGTVISTAANAAATISAAQKQMQIRPNLSLVKSISSPTITTVSSPQQQNLTPAQQKQIVQNIIVQQKQHSQQRNTATLVATSPSGAQTIKSIIIAPTQQALIAASAANSNKLISTTTTTQPVPGTSLISPQIIQIQQNNSQSGAGKIQQLTPQQQQNLIATLKQHQYKNTQQRNIQQQSLIIKQQPMLQQIQKVSNSVVTPTTSIIKSGQSLLGTTNTVPSSTNTKILTSPQSIVTRLLKPGTSIIQQSAPGQQQMTPQQQTVTSQSNIQRVVKTSPLNQQMNAKVLTNSAGQIISLDSLLQKGFAPGTTLRVAGSKPGQTSLIQLPGVPGSQVTQYAVVSQGRNIIPIQNAQRIATTSTANLSSIIKTDAKQLQQSANVITTTAMPTQQISSPKIFQQNATVTHLPAGVTPTKLKPGIRMVNASNLNLAQFGGKPVIIASKTNPNAVNQNILQSQNVILQTSSSSTPSNGGTNFVITQGGQALKILPPGTQTQTVMLNNQLVKVQTQPMHGPSSTVTQANMSSSPSTNATKTVVIGTKLQPQQQTILNTSPGTHTHHQVQQHQVQQQQQTQQVVLGTALKNAVKPSGAPNQQRLVFAVQGGGQYLLPPGFQAGSINLKTLQGLKVIPIQQNQQLSKGPDDNSPQRQIFAQIISPAQQQHHLQQQRAQQVNLSMNSNSSGSNTSATTGNSGLGGVANTVTISTTPNPIE